MRVIDVSASSKELAIEKGLQMLGTTLDNVDIVVLEKGSMLKKAKVEITFFENEQEKIEYQLLKEQKEKNKENTNVVFNELEKEEIVERTELTDEESQIINKLVEFVKEICRIAEVECEVKGKILNNNIYVIVDGEKTGKLIGHHGTTLHSLQVLLNAVVKKNFDYNKKVFIDIEGYKERRKETVEAFAKKMAMKVLKEKRNLKLEPMNSYERKIIHTILQATDHISTHSEGEEPNRYLVIEYVK